MKVTITNPNTVPLDEVPEDEFLVVYNGQLCIREKHSELYTTWGLRLDDIDYKTRVQLIKSIKVEV